MRNSITCPFVPGADAIPDVWAGRVEQLSDWRDVVRPRRLSGQYERGRTILGEAGLGKSALVRRIAEGASRDGDWVTPQLRIPSGADPLKVVAQAVLTLADKAGLSASREKRISDAVRRVTAVAASGVSLTLQPHSGPEPHTVLTDLLVEVGRAAATKNVVVLLHIDEVQNISDPNTLSQLLTALGDALSHEDPTPLPGGAVAMRFLPIAVYLTGLPEFAELAGSRVGATFARRFKTTTLNAIGVDDLRDALHPFVMPGWEVALDDGSLNYVIMEPAAVEAIIDLCRGEPFLFQLAGEQAWYAGSTQAITAEQVRFGWRNVTSEAAAHVERILDRLPLREREFVEAMARLEPRERNLTSIVRELGLSAATAAGPTSQRLDTVRGIISRGKPYSFRHRAVEAYLTTDWPTVP